MYLFQPDRYLLNKQIKKYAHLLQGDVLDIGAGKLSRYMHLIKCVSYITCDIKDNDNIDIVCPAEKLRIRDEEFDGIICTQVLGDLKEPQKAVDEMYRVLKPNGIVIVTESFMNELHDEPNDYWRFTKHGLTHLFRNFEIIAIDQRGGYGAVKAQLTIRYLINRFSLYDKKWARILNPLFTLYGKLMMKLDNPKYALGWCIIIRKRY